MQCGQEHIVEETLANRLGQVIAKSDLLQAAGLSLSG
jgi:hypothetical protein